MYWQFLRCEKGLAAEVVENFPFLRSSASQFFFDPGTIFAYWHEESQRFIHNLVTKVECSDKPNPSDVANAIEALREHAFRNNVKVISMPRLANGLDGLPWYEIQTMLLDIFWNSGIQIQVHYLPFSSQGPLSRPRRDNVSGVHSLFSLNENRLRLSNQNVEYLVISIFIHTTGDLNKNDGLEIEFLLDTGATCSVIKFNTLKAISDVGQNITAFQTQTRTTAFNTSEIRMLGYTILSLSLDIAGRLNIKCGLHTNTRRIIYECNFFMSIAQVLTSKSFFLG